MSWFRFFFFAKDLMGLAIADTLQDSKLWLAS